MILLLAFTVALATLLFFVFLLNQQVRFTVFVLKVVSTICDLVTLPIFLLFDQPWKIQLRSKTHCAERHYEANGDYYYWQAKEDAEEAKLSEENEKLKSSLKKLTHLNELLPLLGKVHKGKKCLGTRKVLGKRLEDGRVKFELSSDYEWRNYEQLKRGDRVATFAETSTESFVIFFALQSLGCEVVFLRSTPNETIIPLVLNQNQVEFVFTQSDFVKLLNKLKPNIRTVHKLICFNHPFASETDEEEIRNAKYKIFDYGQLLAEAQDLPDVEETFNFSPTDISCVINTSGSSGMPKCVLITHANWVAFVNSFKLGLTNDKTFLAYLEGSRIMELTREILYFICGVKIAFGTYDTFLTGSPLLVEGCIGDLQASQATHLIGHPQTIEHIRSLIERWIKAGSAYSAAIYKLAYEYKKRWTKRGFPCRLTDMLLFKSLKNRLSTRLESLSIGGAPLRPETGIFLKLHLNLTLLLDYGTTETMAAAVNFFDQFDYADTLAIVKGVKLRLRNWEEGGYRIDDKPNARGELIIGSDTVSLGYYRNEEKTAEAFFDENGTRWFRSGDIAEINEYGQVSLIDRKSNFVKLQSGNYYIIMSKVESVLRSCWLVENLAIHVNPYCDYVTAIVSPNESNIRKLTEKLGKGSDDLARLLKDEHLEKAVVDELAKFGTANGLIPVEVPSYVKLVPEKWTPLNGLVTETEKLRRKQVYSFYKPLIDAMYQSV